MFERFTSAARNVVVGAQREARATGADRIDSMDLLVALVRDQDDAATRLLAGHDVTADGLVEESNRVRRRGGLTDEDAAALNAVGVDVEHVIRSVEASFGKDVLDAPAGRGKRHVPFGREAKKVLERSLREALRRRHKYIGTEHLLLALLNDETVATGALAARGVTYQGVSERLGKAS
ncbi:Clp protease N-terminal domain-containing protein [Kibdelosporangium phytohabitans]|uniref:Clp R domain-containing protein n=1 Tax=Kibdelosporangium phytohabitans TaxID=860235 RepID=A0A0N9IGP9_9PSEU|nr:Clp protease N-terminal domain-containing protein [Kibdelosporangium phytohabitans]ALG14066.1 hypothetical protein AOZ06_50785 [Kibdelosporangium phytohabitans]MBE1466964.1 hypothetical protein [Kibdelosporangium phytohabitans]